MRQSYFIMVFLYKPFLCPTSFVSNIVTATVGFRYLIVVSSKLFKGLWPLPLVSQILLSSHLLWGEEGEEKHERYVVLKSQ